MTSTPALRRRLKQARLALSDRQRAEAQSAALRRLTRHPRYLKARRVAVYFGSTGELDPMGLLDPPPAGKVFYLPVLHPFRRGRLWFCRWRPGEPLVLNRFGIAEPIPHRDRLIAARRLDLVVVPLLGFDEQCHRLGMGGGYYDRSFAFIRRLEHARRPCLIGFAHECQCIDRLDVQPWDIRLDAVVTNTRMHLCNGRR